MFLLMKYKYGTLSLLVYISRLFKFYNEGVTTVFLGLIGLIGIFLLVNRKNPKTSKLKSFKNNKIFFLAKKIYPNDLKKE